MNTPRLDTLARRLADPLSRRGFGRVLGGLIAGGTVSAAVTPKPALATPQVAASCAEAEPFSNHSAPGVAFTFTPEVSGKLSGADIVISHSWEPEVGYVVQILGTDTSGKPDLNRVLAKKTVPSDALSQAGFVRLPVTFKKRKAARVEAGTTYALLLTRSRAEAGLHFKSLGNNPCTNTTTFLYDPSTKSFSDPRPTDVAFAVFVGY
jgi:hypothetical protein